MFGSRFAETCLAAGLLASLALGCGDRRGGGGVDDVDGADADAPQELEVDVAEAGQNDLRAGDEDAGQDDLRAGDEVADSEVAVDDDTLSDPVDPDLDAADEDADDGGVEDDQDSLDADPDEAVERCRGASVDFFGADVVAGGLPTEATFVRCSTMIHAMVVAAGTRWRLEVEGLPPDARVFVYGPEYRRGGSGVPSLARTGFAEDPGRLEIEFVSSRAGEHFALVTRDVREPEEAYSLALTCIDACDRETTRYPILLVHGYAGVDRYFGLLEYFFDVPGRLRDRGYTVFTPVTDAIATSERRAEQLARQVDAILSDTFAERVNIVAHSQGGLDARYLVSTLGYGDRVASITTIATPHHGVGAALFEFFSAQSFSPETMAQFNADNPDDERVRYWSWSARSCRLLDFSCQRRSAGETVDPLLVATYNLLSRFGDNDGIVTTEAMPWGEHLGLLFADHFDQVGQIADLSLPGDPFDHRQFYRDEARRLATEGL